MDGMTFVSTKYQVSVSIRDALQKYMANIPVPRMVFDKLKTQEMK
jgi:hypothetical protein